MKRRLEIELDVITDLSPFELASKIEPLLQEASRDRKADTGDRTRVRYFPHPRWARNPFRHGAGIKHAMLA